MTAALLWTMSQLIAEEFTPQDVIELASFEINPRVEEVKPIEMRERPKLDAIEVPPAPPPVDIPKTDLPSEPIARTAATPALPGEFRIDIPATVVTVIDSDPQPINRIAPLMPPRATRSGHCRMRFDVSPEGRPFNVEATSCSQSLFSRAAIQSVQKWVYRPEIRDGRPVARTGLQTRITFRLTDEGGRIIPE
ncbi:MAG: energy transducer TonB [Litorimonas sp.]